MVKVVKESVADVDGVMLLVEPIPNIGGPEAELIARIKTLGVPAVLVINKIDSVKKDELTFIQFGVPADRTQEAIDVFRSRYLVTGKFENTPYPGIRELLETLRQRGHRLFVATSKPETTAIE